MEVYSHYTSGLYRNYISKGLTYVKNTGHTTLSHNVIVVSYQFVFGYLSAAVSLVAELLLCLLVFCIALFYKYLHSGIGNCPVCSHRIVLSFENSR